MKSLQPKYQTEVWKDIKGYEGYYQVSNLAMVRSLDRVVNCHHGCTRTIKGRILIQRSIWSGYLYVVLWKNCKYKHLSTHRLVATAFIPNPMGFPQVNHKDEVKTNNLPENLEWCTSTYNANYGTRNERFGASRINSPKISKPVIQCDVNGNVVNHYPSVMEAQRVTGINNANIVGCCIGRKSYYMAGGYKWRYVNE